MAVLPGGNGVPDGGQSPDLGGLDWMQDVTEQGVKDRAMGQVFPSMQNAKNSLIGNFLGGIFTGMNQILQGLNPASWFPQPAFDFAAQIRDGQVDLKDRTDLLSPLLDYGSWCCPPGSGHARFGTGRMPFTYRLGPMRGMTDMGDGRIRLDEPGLWDIRATVTISWTGPVNNTASQWYIRVLEPSGGLHDVFSEQGYYMDTIKSTTMSMTSTVVVDNPGYMVDVYTIGPGDRGWWTGPKWTRLSIQHISNKVEGGTGSESSTPGSNG